ncbi:hypothetical protein Zmor_007410 [Zophobas morio]|uniref:CCDC113/CCDC96 coiled-coil domain-containing protein n=1 Tax=Zophobas morio TaxID=2755281 RepID=A0AA38IZ97_9CUCU|nr:hypothetical protein Zmor_007410 [Zophobas morio]
MSSENVQAEPVETETAETEKPVETQTSETEKPDETQTAETEKPDETTENLVEGEAAQAVTSEAEEIPTESGEVDLELNIIDDPVQEDTQPDQVQPADDALNDVKDQDESQTEEKEDEESPEKTIVEKQDAEEVKEESEQPMEYTEDNFELSLGTPTDLEEIYFKLIEDEEAEEEEDEEGAAAMAVSQERSEKKKKRKSKRFRGTAMPSLQLEAPRLTITGDFEPLMPRRSVETLSAASTMAKTDDEEGGEEDEEVSDEEEELEEEELLVFNEFTREECYEMYNNLDKQFHEEKRKNTYLLKRLVNYYTQKKMFHVIQEGKLPLDVLKKYEKQLDDFEDFTTQFRLAQADLEQEVNKLRSTLAHKENEAQTCFEKLQRNEYEVGKEILDSAGHDEKVIDRYLKRQKVQLNNLKKIRLDYIKIRNKVTETQESLDALDNLGPNLRLIDYEQLKFDNRNLLDKLEEKDLELARVRYKCENAVQILAHRREKVAALDRDLEVMTDRLENLTGEYEDVREQLNGLKQERDLYRSATEQLKKKAGILSQPKLLQNMCETINLSVSLKEELQQVKSVCNVITEKINKIRKNMSSNESMKKIEKKMKMQEFSSDSTTSSISTLGSDLNLNTG